MAEEATLVFKAQTQELVTADKRLDDINKTGKETERVIDRTKREFDVLDKTVSHFNLTGKQTSTVTDDTNSSFLNVSRTIRKMAADTSDLEKTIGLSKDELERYRLSQLGATKAQLDAVKAIQSRRDALLQSSTATKNATVANTNFGNRLGKNNAAVQNTAFQLQDIVVQLEAGVPVTRTLGQQLPQLLGGFGALGAVAGVVAGLGFALGGVLLSGMNDSAEASNKLKEALEELDEVINRTDEGTLELSDTFAKLAQQGGAAFSAQLKEGINDAKDAISAARQESINLAEAISPNELGGRFDLTKLRVEALRNEFIAGKIPLQTFAQAIDEISLKSGDLTGDFRNLREQILEQASASRDAKERLDELRQVELGNIQTTNEHQSSIDRLITNLNIQADAANDAANSTAFYRAQQLGATESELARIQSLQDIIDKQKELAAAEREASRIAEREAEIENQRTIQFQNRLFATEDFLRSEGEAYRDAYNEREAIISAGEKQLLLTEQEAQRLRAQSDQVFQQQRLNSLQGFFGQFAALASSENQNLFNIGKAARIATAAADGISSAISAYRVGSETGGPVVGAAFAAASAAATGALIGELAAAKPPGRAIGGQVTEGQSYRVGEFGPETFVPNSSGRIIPNGQMAANDTRPVEVVNNIRVIGGGGDAQVTTQTTRQNDRKIIQDIVVDLMANQSSPARQALQRTSNVVPRGSR